MSARSQRALRYRQGYDSSGDTAYMYGERSMLTPQEQYNAAVAATFLPPTPVGVTLPVNTVLPAITGTAKVGLTLSSGVGTWTGAPGVTYTRQWRKAGVAIPGATAASYIPVTGDIGSTITVAVTGSNGYNPPVTVVSAPTAAVIA